MSNNPFAMQKAEPVEGAMVQAESERATQEVQAMMIIAKRFPRDPIKAMDRILQSCTRPTLADSALYSYQRGGSEVTGPSIRLAETIAQGWQNFQFGFREVSRGVDSQGIGYSEVEAYAWDIEANTRKPIHFRVKHWRDTKKGGYKLTEERDIYELVANQASRRVRNCILAVIPGDVVDAAQNQCEVTLRAQADTSPEAIKKMEKAFLADHGITSDMLKKRIGRRLETITPPVMVNLKKIYASLRDGMSVPADWFDVSDQPSESSVAERVREKQQSQQPDKKEENTNA